MRFSCTDRVSKVISIEYRLTVDNAAIIEQLNPNLPFSTSEGSAGFCPYNDAE
ncbi:MAG: hypothetical protein ACI9ON_003108 [Limisphaerales bacterium]